MIERCQWNGCTNAALPNLPPGQGVCADHIDEATRWLDQQTRQVTTTVESNGFILRGRELPWWRKPGVVLPWLLFAVFVALTCMYTTMIFWWFVFTPIAWLGWQFGTNNTGRHSR